MSYTSTTMAHIHYDSKIYIWTEHTRSVDYKPLEPNEIKNRDEESNTFIRDDQAGQDRTRLLLI